MQNTKNNHIIYTDIETFFTNRETYIKKNLKLIEKNSDDDKLVLLTNLLSSLLIKENI